MSLSPYESLAYLTLIAKGELSPGKLSQLSGIPRPRTYDVLRTLAVKGLVTERLGRPVRYASIDPKYGVTTRLSTLEGAAKEDIARKREAARGLTAALGKVYDDFHELTGIDQRVVIGGTSSAVWKQLDILKRQTKEEYVGVSVSAAVPPHEIFAADEDMRKRGIKIRLIRPFPSSMRRQHAEWYARLLKQGMEIRTAEHVEFPFDVSDVTTAVIWLNERRAHPPTEAIWLQHAPIARILKHHFESLWRSADPVERVLEKLLVSS